MNVVPLATALPYQVGIQRPAEEHFLAAFVRDEIVEKMRGNGLIEFGAHGRTRTAGLLLTKELLCQRVNCGGLAGVGSGPMATKWSQNGYRQRSEHGRRVGRLNLQLAPLSG